MVLKMLKRTLKNMFLPGGKDPVHTAVTGANSRENDSNVARGVFEPGKVPSNGRS